MKFDTRETAVSAMNYWRANPTDVKIFAAAIRAVYHHRLIVYTETSEGTMPMTLNPHLMDNEESVSLRNEADAMLNELKPHMHTEPESEGEQNFRNDLRRDQKYGATMQDAEMAESMILAGAPWEQIKKIYLKKMQENPT